MSIEKKEYECSECGSSVRRDAKACPKCGASLVSSTLFCPNCRSEYVEGISVCADCGAKLVPELEPIPPPEFVEFDEILSTFNAADIAIIKSLLDVEGIDYYLHGEFFNSVEPLVQPARLMVRREQAATAREILGHLTIKNTISTKETTK